jgi:2-(1,2-epoxy-1,2-dihydrophenyl)acetyl-CoA isomerase
MTPVQLRFEDYGSARVARLTLNRPQRSNSLVPALVDALNASIDTAAAAAPHALLVTAQGRFFSSGGDLSAFAAAQAANSLLQFAEHLVGGVQRAVLALLRFPAPVIVRVQGGVTGGGAGLVLAADLVAMADDAFIQPYYTEVGFAPDGGWCAVLPERIGAARAFALQALNQRLTASGAAQLGLADFVGPEAALDGAIAGWLATLASKSLPALTAARHLVWDAARLEGVTQRMDAERRAFLALVGSVDTQTRLRRFLA